MTDQEISTFLKRLSFGGLLGLYAVKLSFEKNKAFDITDYAKNGYASSYDYLNGVLVTCVAMDLIGLNRTGPVLTITNIHPYLKANIETSLGFLTKKTPQWADYIKKTDNYFQ